MVEAAVAPSEPIEPIPESSSAVDEPPSAEAAESHPASEESAAAASEGVADVDSDPLSTLASAAITAASKTDSDESKVKLCLQANSFTFCPVLILIDMNPAEPWKSCFVPV